jgi:3-mercaptopyruvate sulfurtransferase SseA
MAKTLRNAGFRDVVPLTGGLDAWRLAGFEVSRLTEFGEDPVMTEEVGEMAAMCPWPVKSPGNSASLQEAGFPHGDRA